ncbi:MAG: hypothetical protein F4W95_07170 [Chloroflexi bacterium]|nr:hypothetical protein [Chloroflexota bacterium]MYD48251.1 hypothetical protein [Chloroflexota bacterium]
MALPNIETMTLGRPVNRLGISFIPVYLMTNALPDIATGDDSGLEVNELDSPEVATLSVANPTHRPILAIQGEQLVGGDQNRTLNVSVLIPPLGRRQVPVSCLEQGRWGNRRNFARGSAIAPNSVRMTLLRSVGASACGAQSSQESDQGRVWEDVRGELQTRGVISQNQAMADADDAPMLQDPERNAAANELTKLGPLPGQCGLVVAHRNRAVSADIMGSPALFAAHWERLVRAHLSERVSTQAPGQSPLEWDAAVGPALRILTRMSMESRRPLDAVGMGNEHHVEGKGYVGHALTLGNATVHAVACFTGS